VFGLLVPYCDPKKTDNYNRTAIHHAAEAAVPDVARLMVEEKLSSDTKDGNGYSALHITANNGHETIIQTLVALGVNVDAEDERGWTALHLAAKNNNEAVVRTLVDLGANFNAEDERGWTALHLAAENGSEAAVRTLIDLGADINAKDKGGRMALHIALANGHVDVLLLAFYPAAGTSLFIICSNMKRRLQWVPGFQHYLDEEEKDVGEDLDPVTVLWRIFRRGYPLMDIYNILGPKVRLGVDDSNKRPGDGRFEKQATYNFLRGCVQDLRFPHDECFSISDLYGDDMTGFVKVVSTSDNSCWHCVNCASGYQCSESSAGHRGVHGDHRDRD